MNQRKIREGKTRWQCVQAYAGVESLSEKELENATGDAGHVEVVCTPSGGAQTIRLTLPSSWLESMSDSELKSAIRSGASGQ